MTTLPFIILLILLYLSLSHAADLSALAPHLDKILIAVLSLGVGIETFSLLAKILTSVRIFWLAEALLIITMPVRRLALLIPHWYPAHLYAVECNYLQTVLQEQQKYVEALEANSDCLQVLKKRYGARSRQYAAELINRSFLLGRLSRCEEAEGCAREAMDISKDAADGSPDDVMNLCKAMNNLGVMLLNQGKNEQASDTFEACLNIERRYLPENDPALARSYGNIGYTYLRERQYAAATRYCRQALEMAQESPLMPAEAKATICNNLGEALLEQGKLDEAEPLLVESLTMREKLLGEMHPHRACSYHNLARLCFDQQKLSDSERYFKRALLIREKFPGARGSDLKETVEAYCLLLHKQGRSEEATALKQKQETGSPGKDRN
jgi:tetratricopeptide (TPR) repeat protein